MRKLTPYEISFRVGMIKSGQRGAFCTLLAYKDARVDMTLLDELYGPENWQNKYERDSKGVLQCGIGVRFSDSWVWKWSNGVESATESIKGEYSDAFKRAGFMWGIGRELYEMPTIMVNMLDGEYMEVGGKLKQTGKFRPNDWDWEITSTRVYAEFNKKTRVNIEYGVGEIEEHKIVEEPKKQELKPNTDKWAEAIKYLANGGGVISNIEAKYIISKENKDKLMDEVLG